MGGDGKKQAAETEVVSLLKETLAALEHFDNDALARLLQRAERLSDAAPSAAELLAAVPQQRALAELLTATGRNLRMLRRLRGEENTGERMIWVR